MENCEVKKNTDSLNFKTMSGERTLTLKPSAQGQD